MLDTERPPVNLMNEVVDEEWGALGISYYVRRTLLSISEEQKEEWREGFSPWEKELLKL